MIPVRAEKKPRRRAIIVWAIAAMCVAALVRLTLRPAHEALDIVKALGVVPVRFLSAPLDLGQLLTVITSVFLHAGWIHLAGNMLFLAVFGPTVESRLGRLRFAALYVVAGVTGAMAFVFTHPASAAPLVGASGAIAGVLGAHLILEPRARITTVIPVFVYFEVASLPAAFVIAIWFAFQVASTVAPVAPDAAQAGVAWVAHLAGFAAGLVMAIPARLGANKKPKIAGERRPARTGERKKRDAAWLRDR